MSHSENRNLVVLVIDRLGANMLSVYGSTWIETPNFNRLAARSLVFDQCITRSPDLVESYRGLWLRDEGRNRLTTWGEFGLSSTLITDENQLADSSISEAFDRLITVPTTQAASPAKSIEETQLGNFFAQSVTAIEDLEPGSCLWLHSQGLSGRWDAPLELRQRLADPEDPAPPKFVDPPNGLFNPDTDDPDVLLGYQQVCAAQVTMIDDFLGVVLDLVDANPDTLFTLCSTRGYPLGEHGLVGDLADHDFLRCHNETTQVPLMVCLPDGQVYDATRSVRVGNVVQPNGISDLLDQWLTDPNGFDQSIEQVIHSFPHKHRELAYFSSGDAEMIQTHAWKMIRSRSSEQPLNVSLFAKPDDRWEVNDVSRRCAVIVDLMSQILDNQDWINFRDASAKMRLPDELAIRID